MAQQIQDIMTTKIHAVGKEVPLRDVARIMRDEQIGDVLVTNRDGTLCGIVTDRDIVVRADASDKPLDRTPVGDICTDTVIKLSPGSSIDDAVALMRAHAVRRVPVVRDGHAVGIVTIGDLAQHKDPDSALAQISAASPKN
jgi:CBS domain-containing protein